MKWLFGAAGFAAGAVVGLIAARAYFKANALVLVGGGIGDKAFGEGTTGAKITRGVFNTIQGLASD